MQFLLTILGTRGSMATGGPAFSEFGGDTSCYLVQAGEESIFLDAGTGLMHAPAVFPKPPIILLSHLHLDHIIGLGMYPRLSKSGEKTYIYVPARTQEEAKQKMDGVFSPPYWPLSLTGYKGDVRIKALQLPFSVGGILVEGMSGNHPGGSVVFKLSIQGKSLVYATDYEPDDESFGKLIAFSKDADMILYDGQYRTTDMNQRKGYGHSTMEEGIELLEKSGAKRLLLVHHDPNCSDGMLRERIAELHREDVGFARQGEVIRI